MKLALEQRIFLRSLCWQTSWNFARMQCLGLAFAIYPLLENLYGDRPEDLRRRLRRYLVCFNSNPYMAAAILGFLVHMEKQGEAMGDQGLELSGSLAGLYGSVGDAFFWNGLKPLVCVLATAVYFWRPGLLAPLLLLLVYNVIHLGLRYAVFLYGLQRGIGVIETINSWHLPQLRAVMEQLTTALLAVIVYGLLRFYGYGTEPKAAFLLLLLFGAGLFFWQRRREGRRPQLAQLFAAGLPVLLLALFL